MAHQVKLAMDGLLINWLKELGEAVAADDVIAEFEADKATVEVEAGASGALLELRAEPGDELDEGAVIAVIGAGGETALPAAETAAPSPTAAATAANGDDGRIKASPLARRIAADQGIDLRQVQGSGPAGRIVKADVESWKSAPAKAFPPAAPMAQPTWGRAPEEDVEILELTRMRRAIANGTIKSKGHTPHFYITVEVDVEPLLTLRRQINAALAAEGVKVTVNDLLIKALAMALLKFPNLNTHYYGDRLVRHKRVHIGVSVALPDHGLVNVVCRDADQAALSAMAVSNQAMYARARQGKIKPEDIRGATFTISNLGPFDVKDFSAIISAPEAGILAVSSARQVPVALEDGSLGVGARMNMTLSVDHRVSNGAEGAAFCGHLRRLLENPVRLLI